MSQKWTKIENILNYRIHTEKAAQIVISESIMVVKWMKVSGRVKQITTGEVIVTEFGAGDDSWSAYGLDHNEETIMISLFGSSMTVPGEGVLLWVKNK